MELKTRRRMRISLGFPSNYYCKSDYNQISASQRWNCHCQGAGQVACRGRVACTHHGVVGSYDYAWLRWQSVKIAHLGVTSPGHTTRTPSPSDGKPSQRSWSLHYEGWRLLSFESNPWHSAIIFSSSWSLNRARHWLSAPHAQMLGRRLSKFESNLLHSASAFSSSSIDMGVSHVIGGEKLERSPGSNLFKVE